MATIPFSHQNTPDLQYESLNGLAYHASYKPSKSLRELTLKPLNSQAIQNLPKGLDKFDMKKLLRKYYSKKVSHITCFHSDYTQYSRYRCKTLKNLTLVGRCAIKAPLFPLRSLTISDIGTSTKFKGIKANKITWACKHLETLVFNKEVSQTFFKGIRKMRNLKAITVTLTEEQILNSSQVILSLRFLKKINLVVIGHPTFKTSTKIELLLKFFKQLLSLESLKVLKLSLHQSLLCTDQDFVEGLFSYLSQSRLSAFNIKTKIEDCGPLDMDKIGSVINQADFLVLRGPSKVTSHVNPFMHPIIPHQTDYLDEMNQNIAKSQKVVDFFFGDLYESSLLQILSVFQHSNQIGRIYFNLKEAGTRLNILQTLSCIQNMKDITLDLENLADRNIRPALLSLIEILKKAISLENLTLCDSNAWIYTSVSKNRAIEALSRELPCIKSLKSLRIENLTLNVISLESARKMFMGLRNLKQLYFSLRTKGSLLPSNFFFPYEELSQLTELKIKICAPVTLESMEHFILNLPKLQDLQVLEIMEGSLIGITIDLVHEMIIKLSMIKNLKNVVINVTLDTNQMEYLAPHHEGQAEEVLVLKLREELRTLFCTNCNLEKVHLYQSNWFDIKYIR